MSFLGYLLLGGVMYVAGFMLNLKWLNAKRKSGEITSAKHPWIVAIIAVCFVVMLLISTMIGKFILHHHNLDYAFIIVNSLVATVVFYFGLNPDIQNMNLPD